MESGVSENSALHPQHAQLPQDGGGIGRTLSFDALCAWLDALPAGQPLTVADTLAEFLPQLCERSPNVRTRLKQLETILARAVPGIVDLENMLDHFTLPLPPASRHAAASADGLLKAFGEAYFELAEQLDGRWFRLAFSRIHALAVMRATQLIHRRAILDHRVYSHGSPRRWERLLTLLAMARENAFADKPVDPRSSATIERIITHTSLISLAEPATLGNQDLGRLRFFIERYGHLASLTQVAPLPTERREGLFLVSGSSHGPRHLAPEYRLKPGESVLDVRPLLARLRRQVEGLRRGISPMRLGLPPEAGNPAYLHLLGRCLQRWSRTNTRQHTRGPFNPRADLVSGFDAIRQFLSSSAFRRRRSDHLRGLGNDHTPTSEWIISNQSAAGFGIRLCSGDSGSLSVGELVALRPNEASVVHLCAVRRARSLVGTGLEVGLQLLCSLGIPATVSRPTSGGPQAIPILLLPKVPHLAGKAALLAPPGQVASGLEMLIPHKGRNLRLETVATAEHFVSCDLVELTSAKLARPGRDARPQGA